MNNETVHEEDYKGCKIEIVQDNDAESPQDWGNTDCFLVGYDSRNFWVQSPKEYHKLPEGVKRDPQDKGHEIVTKEEVIQRLEGNKNILKDYHVFGLEAYIHSGVSLALSQEGNFPDRRWDVSQLGAVLVEKKDTRLTKTARKYSQGLIKTWNDYLSGNVYGFRSLDETGEEIHSCWGFYGDYEESGIITNAKAEIDCYIESKNEVLSGLVVMA